MVERATSRRRGWHPSGSTWAVPEPRPPRFWRGLDGSSAPTPAGRQRSGPASSRARARNLPIACPSADPVAPNNENPALAGLSPSGRRDSNSGPLVPQTSALTRLRHAPRPRHPSGHPERDNFASADSRRSVGEWQQNGSAARNGHGLVTRRSGHVPRGHWGSAGAGRPSPNGTSGRTPRWGRRNGQCYPERQMFRAVYPQIARFLNWVNRTGSGSSASRATREAEDTVGTSRFARTGGPKGLAAYAASGTGAPRASACDNRASMVRSA